MPEWYEILPVSLFRFLGSIYVLLRGDFEGEIKFKWGRIVKSGFSGTVLCILILRFMERLDELRVQLTESSRVVRMELMSGLDKSENRLAE